MSKEIYHFEAADRLDAGHSLKEKVTAVYKLAGFIEKRYRNAEDGSPEPYWAYVERGGKETGIKCEESAEALQAMLAGEKEPHPSNKQVGSIRRIFIGLHRPDGGEPIRKETVLRMLATRFQTFTVTEVTGYYEGTPEPTLIVEIAAPVGPSIEGFARDLADAFDQDAVGIENNGIYTRVFGERRREKDRLVNEDRERLNRFVKSINEGQSFDELDAAIQAWWLNRY